MNRGSIANQYDVLGLAPDASGDDIETAFDRLIRRGGFRAGLPFYRRPQRVWQIMAAYETLHDPERRRAYDESLRQPSDSFFGASTDVDESPDSFVLPPKKRQPPNPAARTSSIVGTGTDAATDSLVQPVKRRGPPREAANETAAPVVARAESESVGPAELPQEPPRGRAEPPTNELSGLPERADTTDARREVDAPADERTTPAGAYWTSYGTRRIPVRNLGAAAAVTLILGAALFAFWPSGEAQRADVTQPSPTSAVQKSPGASSPGLSPVVADRGSANGEALNREEKSTTAVDASAVPASTGSDPAIASEMPAPSSGPDAIEAQAQSPAAAAPAPVDVPAPTPAPAATPAQTAPSNTPSGAQPAASAISPPTWLGSGPRDSDNPGGRYQGSVAVQLGVGAEGRVSRCNVVRPSGDAELDALTCRVLVERGRFVPAHDAQGRSVASQAYATYVWGRGRRPNN